MKNIIAVILWWVFIIENAYAAPHVIQTDASLFTLLIVWAVLAMLWWLFVFLWHGAQNNSKYSRVWWDQLAKLWRFLIISWWWTILVNLSHLSQ